MNRVLLTSAVALFAVGLTACPSKQETTSTESMPEPAAQPVEVAPAPMEAAPAPVEAAPAVAPEGMPMGEAPAAAPMGEAPAAAPTGEAPAAPAGH